LASEVIQHLRELELQVNVYVDDRLYVEAVGEWAQRYAAYADVQINVVDDLIALVRTPPTKIVVPAEPSEVDELLPRLQARWAGRLRVTRSLPQYVEICDLSATKSGALQYLCNGSGWRRERCVACGDGLNDVDMLRWAGLGVAMGQAAPAVKEAADLVIDQADLGQFFTRLAEAREA
jgi:hydroxymethylpyrimidine pyrophosphatase-like HAD family hydrolase